MPLPSVPEVFGVRLPSSSDCLTAVDFDLVPNKPPPGVKLYDEEIEEGEESDEDEEDREPAAIPASTTQPTFSRSQDQAMDDAVTAAPTAGAPHTPSDVDMMTPVVAIQEEPSEAEEEDGLFAGGDEEDESGDEAMDVSALAPDIGTNGLKRKLVEEDDYD